MVEIKFDPDLHPNTICITVDGECFGELMLYSCGDELIGFSLHTKELVDLATGTFATMSGNEHHLEGDYVDFVIRKKDDS